MSARAVVDAKVENGRKTEEEGRLRFLEKTYSSIRSTFLGCSSLRDYHYTAEGIIMQHDGLDA